MRNSISFDEFRLISDFTSLRQGWVHLVINGVDHGLYQWLEEPDTDFLAAHGLDPKGTLYKSRDVRLPACSIPPLAADPGAVRHAGGGERDTGRRQVSTDGRRGQRHDPGHQRRRRQVLQPRQLRHLAGGQHADDQLRHQLLRTSSSTAPPTTKAGTSSPGTTTAPGTGTASPASSPSPATARGSPTGGRSRCTRSSSLIAQPRGGRRAHRGALLDDHRQRDGGS